MSITIYNKAGLFYTLSILIPWSLWFLAGYISHINSESHFPQQIASVIAFIGLCAPIIVVIALALKDKSIFSDLKGRFFNFQKIKITYVLLTLFLMPASILLAQAISLLFGYSIEQFRFAESFSFTSGIFPVWFMLIIAPLLEELAWHSYGTDSLRSRYNLFKTSLIFALFWGVWHLPLTTIKDYYHSNLVTEGLMYSLNFLLSLFPFVLIMNWIYYKSSRNIVLTIVFHICAGYFNEIFSTHPMSKVIQTWVLIAFSAYIIYNDRSFFFNHKIIKS